MSITFTIPGTPQGKGRARVGRGPGGHARMFTPPATVAYEGLIALAAQTAMNGAEPFKGPVRLQIEAVATVPASWSQKRRLEASRGLLRPLTKPDIDNIVKAVADGGNGVVWADDKQIVELAVSKRYGEPPRVEVVASEVFP